MVPPYEAPLLLPDTVYAFHGLCHRHPESLRRISLNDGLFEVSSRASKAGWLLPRSVVVQHPDGPQDLSQRT